MKKFLVIALLLAAATVRSQEAPPIRLAIVGLVHDHVRSFIPRVQASRDFQLVGIVEPNSELSAEIAARDHLDPGLFFPSIDALVAKVKVQVVATFTSTFDHRRVVEACASLGIDVMMEKPLAVTLADGRAIAAAAAKGGIQVVVNYETTWYPSTQAALGLVRASAIGDLRKIVVHDGHQGPAAIGCSRYFLAWLTDPVLNGGGASMDFGCYGADLVTVLMGGRPPTSVVAVAQHFQPEVYPKVEDESTIVLTYPRTQAIIQASWNWPFDRKDMEIYGQAGTLKVPNRETVLERRGRDPEAAAGVPALSAADADSLAYLAAVVRGETKPSGLSSLETNLVVTEILDAARESARTGRRIDL